MRQESRICTRGEIYLDFHWVTRPWRQTLTNGSDVEYLYPSCPSCRPHTDQLTYPLLTNHQTTTYRPPSDHLPTTHRPLLCRTWSLRCPAAFLRRWRTLSRDTWPTTPVTSPPCSASSPVNRWSSRVINLKFPLQPHQKYNMTQYGELS